VVARSRGMQARYCSQSCRWAAAKRRYRAARRLAFERLAKTYVWWKSPLDKTLSQRRVVAQLMDIGDFDDVRLFAGERGEGPFFDALQNAEPGWFSPRSWKYWHLRLRMMAPGDATPAMPTRKVR
jgi:hypothetical protein